MGVLTPTSDLDQVQKPERLPPPVGGPFMVETADEFLADDNPLTPAEDSTDKPEEKPATTVPGESPEEIAGTSEVTDKNLLLKALNVLDSARETGQRYAVQVIENAAQLTRSQIEDFFRQGAGRSYEWGFGIIGTSMAVFSSFNSHEINVVEPLKNLLISGGFQGHYQWTSSSPTDHTDVAMAKGEEVVLSRLNDSLTISLYDHSGIRSEDYQLQSLADRMIAELNRNLEGAEDLSEAMRIREILSSIQDYDEEAELTLYRRGGTPFFTTPYESRITNFSYNRTTHLAVNSGNWSSAGTWAGGVIPPANAVVEIPQGVTVTYDVQSDVKAESVVIFGTLDFRTDIHTRMRVNNLQVAPTGTLTIGTAANPVAADVNAEIIFNDSPVNTALDPEQWGNGLVALGKVTIHGAVKSFGADSRLAAAPRAGQTTLTFVTAPTGWRAGDRLALPDSRQLDEGQNFGGYNGAWGMDVVQITAISADGRTITITRIAPDGTPQAGGFRYDHPGTYDGQFMPHVANLTHNVSFRSENTSETAANRGMVYFTHRAEVDVRYAQFMNLGRTTESDTDDTAYNSSGQVTHIGTNQSRRGPVTFHNLAGPASTTNPYQYTFVGNSIHQTTVDTKFRWGLLVENSQYGLIQGNNIHNHAGAGLILRDARTSYNVIEKNFVLTVIGDRARRNAGEALDGSGFYGEAGALRNNYLRFNVASGTVATAQDIVAGGGYVDNSYPGRFTFNLPLQRGVVMQGCTINVTCVQRDSWTEQPILEWRDNEAYGAMASGVVTWALSGDGYQVPNVPESIILRQVVWHAWEEAWFGYPANRLTMRDWIVRGDPNSSWCCSGQPRAVGFDSGDYKTPNFSIIGADVRGVMNAISGSTDTPGVYTVRDSYFETIGAAISWNAQKTPGTQAGVSPRRLEVHNTRFVAFNNSSSFRAIDMSEDTSLQDSWKNVRDEVFVYDFNGVPGANFQIWYKAQGIGQPNYDPQLAGGPAPCTTAAQCELWRQYAVSWGVIGLMNTLYSPAPTPPSAPSGLSGTAVSSSQTNLSWTDNSNNETGFEIERKTGASGTYARIATTAADITSYQDTGLTPGTTYYYRVRAINAVGNSLYSNEFIVTTPSVPAAPSGLTGSASSNTQVNLAWTDNATNETGFEIERKTGVSGTYARIATTAANVTSYQNTGLTAGTTYYYRVRAVNGVGNSPYSGEFSVTPDVDPPVLSPVTTPGTTDRNPATPELDVDRNSTVTYRSSAADITPFTWQWIYKINGGPEVVYRSGSGPNITDAVFTYGSTDVDYEWIIRVRDLNGNQAQRSLLVKVRDWTAPTISAVGSSNVTSSGAKITWTTDEAADSQVEYCVAGQLNCPRTPLDPALVTSHSVNLSGLTPDTNYEYRVFSKDAAGNLQTSADFTFTTPANAAPVVGAISLNPPDRDPGTPGNQVYPGNVTYSIAQPTDADGDTLTSQWAYRIDGGAWVNYGTPGLSVTYTYASADIGRIYDWRVTVSDPFTGTVQVVTVQVVNSPDTIPPVISVVASSNTTPNSATITWTTSEAADTQVEYGLTTAYGSLSNLNTAMVTSHTMTLNGLAANTTYHFRARSRDAAGNLATSADFTFTTTNTVPVANDQSVTTDEDTARAVTLTATDPDAGASLTYAIVGNPSNGTMTNFNPNTGTLTYTPNANYNGTDSFTFKVNDGTVDSPAVTVALTITPVNDAPVMTPVQNQTMNVGETLNLTVNASDVDGDALTLTAPGLPGFGSFRDNGDGTATVTFTPAAGQSGSYNITVQALDPDGLADQITFRLDVRNPQASIQMINYSGLARTCPEGAPCAVVVRATSSDNSPVQLTASNLPSWATFADNGDGTGTILGSAGFNDAGTYDVLITARDLNNNLQSTLTARIVVTDTQKTPTITTVLPELALRAGERGEIRFSVADPENDSLTVTVDSQFADGAVDPLVRNGNDFILGYTPNAIGDGDHRLILKISDGTNVRTVIVTVIVYRNLVASVRDGNWDDPATWGGAVPQAGDRVEIRNHKVTLNTSAQVVDVKIKQGGTLYASRTQSGGLDVMNRIVVEEGGTFDVGTAADPVLYPVTHHFTVRAQDPKVIQGNDAFAFSNLRNADLNMDEGIYVEWGGRMTVHGNPVRSWTTLARDASAGEITVQLHEAAAGLRVGDELEIVGWRDINESEVRTVVAISPDGKTIILDRPLAYNHPGLQPFETTEVIFRNRNINFQYGHIMGLRNSSMSVSYARLEDMGFEALGRYPLHFHLVSTLAGTAPQPTTVEGNLVLNSKNNAYVVHSTSDATVVRNVARNVAGVGPFFLEAADRSELRNAFAFNLAVGVTGTGRLFHIAALAAALGYDLTRAAGFWYRGGNVDSEFMGNRVAHSVDAAFAFTANVGVSANDIPVTHRNVARMSKIGSAVFGKQSSARIQDFVTFLDVKPEELVTDRVPAGLGCLASESACVKSTIVNFSGVYNQPHGLQNTVLQHIDIPSLRIVSPLQITPADLNPDLSYTLRFHTLDGLWESAEQTRTFTPVRGDNDISIQVPGRWAGQLLNFNLRVTLGSVPSISGVTFVPPLANGTDVGRNVQFEIQYIPIDLVGGDHGHLCFAHSIPQSEAEVAALPVLLMDNTGPNGGPTGKFNITTSAVPQPGYFVIYTADRNHQFVPGQNYKVVPVNIVNAPPAGQAAAVNAQEDAPVSITLSGTDQENDPLTFAITAQPANGTLSGFDPAAGTVTYTPNPDYFGTDSFTYTVSDPDDVSKPIVVTINIRPVNDAPAARDQAERVDEDQVLSIRLNVSDADGDRLTVRIAGQPANGTLSCNGTDCSYRPNADFNGTDTFTYRVHDGTVDSNLATVTITVNAVNDAPVVRNQTVTGFKNTSTPITLGGFDPDGDLLNFIVSSTPLHGTLRGTPPRLTYTPKDPNFTGTDDFAFKVSDGNSTSEGRISIIITVLRPSKRSERDTGTHYKIFGDRKKSPSLAPLELLPRKRKEASSSKEKIPPEGSSSKGEYQAIQKLFTQLQEFFTSQREKEENPVLLRLEEPAFNLRIDLDKTPAQWFDPEVPFTVYYQLDGVQKEKKFKLKEGENILEIKAEKGGGEKTVQWRVQVTKSSKPGKRAGLKNKSQKSAAEPQTKPSEK